MEKNHTGIFQRKVLTKKDYQALKEDILSYYDEESFQTMLDYGFTIDDIIPTLFHTTAEIAFIDPKGLLTAYRLENELLGNSEHHDDGTDDFINSSKELSKIDEFLTIEQFTQEYHYFILRSFVSACYFQYNYWLYTPDKMSIEQQRTVEQFLPRYQSPSDMLQEHNGIATVYKRPIYCDPTYLKNTTTKK